MVLKTKPWKSGTNKLSLSRQFRAACKKLERLNLTFLRTRFIFRKGQGIYWKKIFARKGPLPLPNRFLRPTRVHLEVLNHPHPPDRNYWPFHVINRASITVFCSIQKLRKTICDNQSCDKNDGAGFHWATYPSWVKCLFYPKHPLAKTPIKRNFSPFFLCLLAKFSIWLLSWRCLTYSLPRQFFHNQTFL